MLDGIRDELRRVAASDVHVSLDSDFEPAAGTLLKVEIGDAYWHLLPETFRQLLGELPDRAGSDAVHQAIESLALPLWHGPSPQSARE
jgi:hypothetical protein